MPSKRNWKPTIFIVVTTLTVLLALFGLFAKENATKKDFEANYRNYEIQLEKDEKNRKEEEEKSRQKTAVFIGDSTTAGTGASYPNLDFASIFSRNNNLIEFNYARGGTGYPTKIDFTTLKLSEKEIELNRKKCGLEKCPNYFEILSEIQIQPDYVFITGGRNNRYQISLESTVPRFLSEVRKKFPNSRIIVTSPIGGTDEVGENIQQLRRILKTTLKRIPNTYYLNLGDPLQGSKKLVKDGVHPNDEGHQVIAELMTARFLKYKL